MTSTTCTTCIWCGRRPGACPSWCPAIDEQFRIHLTGEARPEHLQLVT
ncbi:MAG: hypothetical protein JWN67_5020 [Actinomycetia bacterium]|nr:hypothetical protein [Actinomycetes bacterium]